MRALRCGVPDVRFNGEPVLDGLGPSFSAAARGRGGGLSASAVSPQPAKAAISASADLRARVAGALWGAS
jgi:hypothetical protein